MYQLIVFDLDGTILDTLDDLANAVNYALRELGLPTRTREEVRSFVGNGIARLMSLAVGEQHTHLHAQALQSFKTYYGTHCNVETRVYDGIVELLNVLKEKGLKTAVLSNKADFAVKILAEEYFPNTFFIAQGENEQAGIRRKPAPDALFAIIKQAGVTAEETLYVGDSEVDIQTANNAGVDCVSVTWGFKDEAFLKENGGTRIARTPSEILRFL